MSHACGCRIGTDESGEPRRAITADRTVAEITREYPGTLEVMRQRGINHCCGAHLTLTEAAASAGIALEELLGALNTT